MSSYISFYLKVEDKYCSLGSYSRNCSEYQFFKDFVPYEKLGSLTLDHLTTIKEDVNFAIKNKETAIKNYSNNIELIKTFNNSAEEKMQLIGHNLEVIEEFKEDLEEDNKCLSFINFLMNILMNILIDANYDTYAKDHGIKTDNYLWAGIEVNIK